jgi:hypothetical protein
MLFIALPESKIVGVVRVIAWNRSVIGLCDENLTIIPFNSFDFTVVSVLFGMAEEANWVSDNKKHNAFYCVFRLESIMLRICFKMT